MIHIYLDAMGGDNAPQCTVEGAKEALRADKELKITLGGPKAEIEKLLQDCPDIRDRLEIDDCAEIITNHDAPVMAIRQKKQSAQVKGMLLVREGGADGFVSAGSTGATLAGGMFRLGAAQGDFQVLVRPQGFLGPFHGALGGVVAAHGVQINVNHGVPPSKGS